MRPALVITILASIVALSVIGGVVAASSIFQTVPVSATVTILAVEDVDRDGCVGTKDLILVGRNLGVDVPEGADVNLDGQVDVVDLVLVAASIGTASILDC